MSKKGFLYFALGAVAGAAGLYYLKKNGGLHFSIDIDSSDDSDVELDVDEALDDEPDDELNDEPDDDFDDADDRNEVKIIIEKTDDCPECGAEPEA